MIGFFKSSATILTLGFVIVMVIFFGFGQIYQSLAAPPFLLLPLAAILTLLSWYDFRHKRLPFFLTVPLLFAGIVLALNGVLSPIDHSVIGAVLGVLFFTAVSVVSFRVLKREGLGFGDAPLLGAGGAWFGWQALPTIVLVASFSGLIYASAMRMFYEDELESTEIPFGPHLAIGIWAVTTIGSLNG